MRLRAICLAAVFLTILPALSLSEDGDLDNLSDEFFRLQDISPGDLVRSAAEAYGAGDHSMAASLFIKALRADLNDNPVTLYNLACCYGLLGDDVRAGDALVLAAEAGFERLELAATDPDLDGVRDSEYFSRCTDRAWDILAEKALQESEAVLGDRVYLEFPSMQTVRVHLPEDYTEGTPRTLVLALHGYGGDVTEFSSRWEAFEEGDFIFASLQAPYAFARDGRTVYSWTVFGSSPWDGGDMPEDQMLETFGGSMDLSAEMVIACVEALREEYSIDEAYLLGFSQGGIVTYWTALRNPGVFSGIATFSGVLDEEMFPEIMLEEARRIPVFLGRGTMEDDRAVLARDRLLEKGFDVTFHEYEGGHFFPDESLRAFEDWLLSVD